MGQRVVKSFHSMQCKLAKTSMVKNVQGAATEIQGAAGDLVFNDQECYAGQPMYVAYVGDLPMP